METKQPELRKIKLDKINLDAGIQTRTCITNDAVDDYHERMVERVKFPPVTLFETPEGEIILVDGFHRVAASRKGDFTYIDAEVHPGTRQEAIEYALGTNQQHGVRRTNGDKRRAAMLGIKEFGDKSDRWIAERVGVSHVFVNQLRPVEAPAGNGEQPRKRTGRDGKAREVKKREPKSQSRKKDKANTPSAEPAQVAAPKMTDNERIIDLCNFVERQVKVVGDEIKDLTADEKTELGQILASVDRLRESRAK